MKFLPSKILRSVAPLLLSTLALVGAQPGAAQGPMAKPEQVEAMRMQLDWVEEVVARLERHDRSIEPADARELRLIDAQLTRLERIARTSGEAGRTNIQREEAEELQDRIAQAWLAVRSQTRRGVEAARTMEPLPAPPPPAVTRVIPSRTNVSLRLTTWLSSKNAAVGDRFSALLNEPILVGGTVAVPRGAVFEGMVTQVDRAGRASDAGRLHLFIDRLRGDQGQIADVRGLVVGTGSGDDLKGKSADAGKTAAGAVAGGILGGILGGKEGALVGLGVGAGGSLLAQKGKDVDLPQGSVLRVELQDSVIVSWEWAPAPGQ